MVGINIKDFVCRTLFAVCAGIGLSACDPISPEDKAFFDEQDRLRGEKIATMRAANVGVTMEDVINRIKQLPADDTDETTESWIFQQVFEMGGEMLFPRWDADRRGSNIQEVRFEFVLLSKEGKMTRYRYSWEVDVLDMNVKGPELTALEEIESPEQMLKNQQLRRVQHYEQELK